MGANIRTHACAEVPQMWNTTRESCGGLHPSGLVLFEAERAADRETNTNTSSLDPF